MAASLKKDILNAIWIVIMASVVGLITNVIRTPIFEAKVERGAMKAATANYFKGVNLIDDWSHEGWPWEDDNEEPAIGGLYFAEAQAVFQSGEAIFVDARILSDYNERHIEGAIPWPVNEFS